MARIKIKELPVITYDSIKDTDIMVVENKEDTFQASITDMKKVFSCDAKLTAIVESINTQLKALEDILNENNNTISGNMAELEDQIGVIKNNIDSILSRLKTAEANIEDHEERIEYLEKSNDSVLERLDENDKINETQNENLDNLNKDNETNKNNISDLQEITQEHEEHLITVDETLESHKDLIDQNKQDVDNAAQENFDYLNQRIEDKYMELLDIIDFYHHITHDDEGNLVEDRTAIKAYPIGAEFVTTSTDDPGDYFGGTWKMIGSGAREYKFTETSDEGQVIKTYTYTTYTWVREA